MRIEGEHTHIHSIPIRNRKRFHFTRNLLRFRFLLFAKDFLFVSLRFLQCTMYSHIHRSVETNFVHGSIVKFSVVRSQIHLSFVSNSLNQIKEKRDLNCLKIVLSSSVSVYYSCCLLSRINVIIAIIQLRICCQ